MSRAYYDPAIADDLRRLQLSRASSRTSARSRRRHGRASIASSDIKGPLIYTVTSLAWIRPRHALLHDRQRRATAIWCALDPATQDATCCMKDARIGDLVFNRSGPFALGHPPPERPLHARPDRRRRIRMGAGRHVAVRHRSCTTSTSRRTARGSSASFGEISGKQDVRVLRRAASLRGDPTPVARFDFGTVGAEQLRVLARRPLSVRQLVLHRRLEHLPLRARDEEARGRHATPRRDSSGPIPLGGDELIVFRYTGRRLRAGADRRAAARGRQRDHVSRRAAGRGASGRSRPWMSGRRRRSRSTRCAEADGHVSARRRAAPRVGLSRSSQGYKDTAASGWRLNLSDPLQLNRAAALRRRTRRPAICRPASACISARVPALRLARARGAATAPTSTICSVRRRRAARATRSGSGTRAR